MLEQVDLSTLDENAWQAAFMQRALTPFALATEHPFRVTLAKVGSQAWVLLIVIHHTACDGSTGSLLVRELAADYDRLVHGKPGLLSAPDIQAADFANWQHKLFTTGGMAADIQAWKSELTGVPTLLSLPLKMAPATGSGRVARLPVRLDMPVLAQLRDIARAARRAAGWHPCRCSRQAGAGAHCRFSDEHAGAAYRFAQ